MRTTPALKALLLAVSFASVSPALAHEGHEHGPPLAEMPASKQPRAIAVSEDYEIVAVLSGDKLLIYVDRFADNSPVTQARLTVTIGTSNLQPQLLPDGVFMLDGQEISRPGRHELILSIQEGRKSDLLIASLDVPEPPQVAAPQTAPVTNFAAEFVTVLSRLKSKAAAPQFWGAGGAIFGLMLLLLWGWRRRKPATLEAPLAGDHRSERETGNTGVSKLRPRSAGSAAAAILLLLLPPAPEAAAHGDEDHGDTSKAIMIPGDAPRRLPDASIYLPKRSQRMLEIRTIQSKETTTRPNHSFVGRVIADPNRFAVVQSALGGRFAPGAAGHPRLGQVVKAGDVLGHVAPFIATIDRSDAAQTAGDLDQQIALAEIRLERAKRLYAVNAGTRVQVEDHEIELKGLQKRRADLKANTMTPEPLVAPIDGVIATAKVFAGQVVEPKDVLFEIIDPSSLWVEAFAFDQLTPGSLSEAFAAAKNSKSYKLRFVGKSRALRQQATVLHFEIETPDASLNVGTPVTVHVREGEATKGVVLPKAAVVRAANGENVVWQHKEPERFVATPIKISPFDGERVFVGGGLNSGERIVTQGAELINQIR